MTGRDRAATGEKRWNLLGLRSSKLKRAKQLGLLWPYRNWEQAVTEERKLRLLFICSMNQWRSPTAEAVYAKDPAIEARSAGTSRHTRKPVAYEDVRWAEMVIVMESKHEAQLRAKFRDAFRYKPLHVLGIPDDYKYMDADLVELIHRRVDPLILGASSG
jgi:predicted protein tyrosine phosphatase